MKSKIFFDIDELNNPIIRVHVSYSQDDIRDKVTQRFFDNLSTDGNMMMSAKVIGHSKSEIDSGSYYVEINPVNKEK